MKTCLCNKYCVKLLLVFLCQSQITLMKFTETGRSPKVVQNQSHQQHPGTCWKGRLPVCISALLTQKFCHWFCNCSKRSSCHSGSQQTLSTTDLNPKEQKVRHALEIVAAAKRNQNQDFSIAYKHSHLLRNSIITIIINLFSFL